MKNTLLRLTLLMTIAFIFTACPYTSTVPITAPSEALNEALFGKWVAASDADFEKPTFYTIEALDANHYEVIENSHYDEQYNKTNYVMHSSMIGGKMFMNVQEAAGGDYHLHMIEMGTDEFTLWEVTNNVDEKFSQSADLKNYIEKNMNLSFFFTSDERKFVRK